MTATRHAVTTWTEQMLQHPTAQRTVTVTVASNATMALATLLCGLQEDKNWAILCKKFTRWQCRAMPLEDDHMLLLLLTQLSPPVSVMLWHFTDSVLSTSNSEQNDDRYTLWICIRWIVVTSDAHVYIYCSTSSISPCPLNLPPGWCRYYYYYNDDDKPYYHKKAVTNSDYLAKAV